MKKMGGRSIKYSNRIEKMQNSRIYKPSISALLTGVLLLNTVASGGISPSNCMEFGQSLRDCCCSATTESLLTVATCCQAKSTFEKHSCCAHQATAGNEARDCRLRCHCRGHRQLPHPATPVQGNRNNLERESIISATVVYFLTVPTADDESKPSVRGSNANLCPSQSVQSLYCTWRT